jgi:YidC/Oxa1 family membrane protein insertase
MKFKSVQILTLCILCLFCVLPAYGATDETPSMQPSATPDLSAAGGPAKTLTLGSLDPNTGFKFLVELTTKGAAISKATLSEFDELDKKNPLVLLSTVTSPDGSQIFSMENQALILTGSKLQLPLNKLDWNALDASKSDGAESAAFEAIIKNKATGEPVIKLTKTYRVTAGLYDVDCNLVIENLSQNEQQLRFDLTGPVGIEREDPRTDTRSAVAAFRDTRGEIVSTALAITKLEKAKTDEQRQLSVRGAGFLWAAITNKYFAAIVVPATDPNAGFCKWVSDKQAWSAKTEGDEGAIGIELKTASFTLPAAGQPQSTRTFDLKLFIGPKERGLFEKNKFYKDLGFVQTFNFMTCCCPTAVIQPLAFGILAIMKWLYGFIPNYGVVIIILVLLVRLILHPLTKKSQVSMSEYSKFNALPEVQEIRKKYSKNLMEMNRHISELQKKHGLSHSAMVMGMLPTMVQMPIWIALYSAIYASIDLRGAEFLPFWITNLSAPDALFRFKAVMLPFFGRLDSFNLLPILMGIAFYLQQKLMPSQQMATTPEAAQQQKMMMFMMPVLFPLMLYTSPSGLNLYIMASVFGGVVEQYVIKKHIQKKEQEKEKGLVAVTSKTGGKVKKPKPKPFFKI